MFMNFAAKLLATRAAAFSLLSASLLLAGCGASSTSPGVSLSVTSLAFTSLAGISTPTQTITITNTGHANLVLTSIVPGGTGAAAFSAGATNCGTNLAAGAYCSVGVVFTPPAVATYSATVTVTDNASPSTQTVALNGVATGLPTPAVTMTPAALVFPTLAAGITSATLPITVTNSGTAPLLITGTPALSGPGIQVAPLPSTFTLANGNCLTYLGAGAACTFSVTYKPTAGVPNTATFTLTDNASPTTQTVAISGN